MRGGRRAVCSAPLARAELVSHQRRGELSGRMEKLRCGSGSGELPIDMQRTVGEMNPRHHRLHLQGSDGAAYVLQRLTLHTHSRC